MHSMTFTFFEQRFQGSSLNCMPLVGAKAAILSSIVGMQWKMSMDPMENPDQ